MDKNNEKSWSKAMDHLNAMQIKIENYHNKVQKHHLKYLKHQDTKNTKGKWKYYGEHFL